MTDPPSFDALRHRAAKFTALACWPMALVSIVTAWAVGNAPLPIALVSVAFAAMASFGSRVGGPSGRLAVSIGFVGQATAFTAALAGHAWQVDSHMVFFALLAVTMGMADVRAVLLTSLGIVLHHVGLTLAMPALVYPSLDVVQNVSRSLFHGTVVLMEAAALCLAIRSRARLDAADADKRASLSVANRKSADAAATAEGARQAAEIALRDAETNRAAAEAAHARAESEAARARDADAAAMTAQDAHRIRIETASAERAHVVAALSYGLDRLAQKDMTCDITDPLPGEHDDLRVNFNVALQALRDAIDRVSSDVRSMARDGAALRDLALNLSDRTADQRSTVEGSAAAIGEVAEQVRVIADGAAKADGMAGEVQFAAERAGTIANETAASMTELRGTAVRINEIVGTIEDIARQTQLLSINARIEAARAGEAGRGFAVVASEVGALAGRSSQAANEIRALAEDSRGRVDRNAALVTESSEALDGVLELVTRMLAVVSEIAGAAEEQSDRLLDIDGALEGLSEIARSNTEAARNSVAAANEIGDRAELLAIAMADFRRPEISNQVDIDAA